MNQGFNPTKLLFAGQNRTKLYSYAQLFNLTGKYPSTLKDTIAEPVPDPLWLLTQSGKNYSTGFSVLQYYSSPSIFDPKYNSYGITNSYLDIKTSPVWAHFTYSNHWFLKQQQLLKIVNLLYCIPGIQKIYLTGSVFQETCKPNADIDLIVQCRAGWVLPSRMWLKILLKLLRLDVHPIRLQLLLVLYNLLQKSTKAEQTRLTIWNYKNRSGIKVDAGMFFENFKQIFNYFELSERNLSAFDIAFIPSFSHKFSRHDFEANHNTIYLKTTANYLKHMFYYGIKVIFRILSIIIYPISILQLPWFKLNKIKDKQLVADFNFCCFFPRYPIYTELTKQKT